MDVFWYVADDRLAAEKFLNGWIKLMETMWNGEMYQNYVSLNVNDYASCYWADALFGLYAVKQKYDPEHAFSFAQEVRQPMKLAPGGPGGPGPKIPLPPQLEAALAQPIVYLPTSPAG